MKCFPFTLRRGSLKTHQSQFILELGHTLGARGFCFCRSEAAIVSGEAAIEIQAREEKKSFWTRQLQASLLCDFETKYLTKPVISGIKLFLFNMSACGTTKWHKINRKMKKNETSVERVTMKGCSPTSSPARKK